jgi:hypothetical protein
MALLGGFLVPMGGFPLVLGDTFAIGIEGPQDELGVHIAGFGRFLQPADRGNVILGYAFAFGKKQSNLVLRFGITGRCLRQ